MVIYDWDFGYNSCQSKTLSLNGTLFLNDVYRYLRDGQTIQAGVAISDSGESKTLMIDCPGIAKADLALEVAPKSEGEAVVRVKGKTGSRAIDVSVPVWNVNVSEVKASYSDGVLTITLPKSAPKAKPVLVPIG
jgi:HSP20 family molecular chaperone IbpA